MPFCLCLNVMIYYNEHHLAMHVIADILINSLFLNQWIIFVQSFCINYIAIFLYL